MKLAEIFSQLRSGELNSLARKDDINSIINYTNLGIIDLYSRFKLQTKEILISLVMDNSSYILPDDCYLVEQITSEYGELQLNQDNEICSVFNPSHNVLNFYNRKGITEISVIYLTYPLLLDMQGTFFEVLDQDVELPYILLEPLLLYIGYKAQVSVDANIRDDNNTYYLRYEAKCKQLEERGAVRNDVVPSLIKYKEGYE